MSLRSIVEQHYQDIRNQDWENGAKLFSPDVVTVMPGTPPMHGIEPFIMFGKAFTEAFPDMHMRLEAIVEQGSTVVARGSFLGTHNGTLRGPTGEIPATGRSIDVPYSDWFDVGADGKVVRHEVFFDSGQLMAQLGVMPEPAQAG